MTHQDRGERNSIRKEEKEMLICLIKVEYVSSCSECIQRERLMCLFGVAKKMLMKGMGQGKKNNPTLFRVDPCYLHKGCQVTNIYSTYTSFWSVLLFRAEAYWGQYQLLLLTNKKTQRHIIYIYISHNCMLARVCLAQIQDLQASGVVSLNLKSLYGAQGLWQLGVFCSHGGGRSKDGKPKRSSIYQASTQVISTSIPLAKASQEAKPKVSNPKVYSAYHEAVTQV